MSKGFGLGYGHRILEHCTERKIQVFGHLDQIFEGELLLGSLFIRSAAVLLVFRH